MARVKLDRIDRRILGDLQQHGRMTNVELAKRAGISPPPCLRRVRALEESLQAIVARHETLRTTFPPNAGRLVQSVEEQLGTRLTVNDLTGKPADRLEVGSLRAPGALHRRSVALPCGASTGAGPVSQ